MVSGIEFNKSYTSSYVILPLKKDNGQLSVSCSDKIATEKIKARDDMRYVDELREADIDKNNIISLNELKNSKNKTDFMKKLELAMEKFNANPNRDYTKNLFDEYI